jgi:hypothetical protein
MLPFENVPVSRKLRGNCCDKNIELVFFIVLKFISITLFGEQINVQMIQFRFFNNLLVMEMQRFCIA